MVAATAMVVMLFSCFFFCYVFSLSAESAADASGQGEVVLTLDASNLSDTIIKHPFIVVEFYGPWCRHCKDLATEYEKAASSLRDHDRPVVLAKIDASDELNKDLAIKYEVKVFPTLKILRDGGKDIQEYKGPRYADGIVEYLKKQLGPASVEIKSVEDGHNLISNKKISIVGVFPEFSGEGFENFTALAEKLRSDYDFGHTLDARLLPRGEPSVNPPIIRLFKPFDELFVDFQDFHVDAMEKFMEEAIAPTMTIFDKDPFNCPFVSKFFNGPNTKAMLFLNFVSEYFEAFKSAFHHAAEPYKGKAIRFLLGDIEANRGAMLYFGSKETQVPAIIIHSTDGQKYAKSNLEPGHIAPWLKEYTDGALKPFRKSEPIPEVNNDPFKVVIADSLNDVVLNSGKNVLLEFYAPWCGHCQKLAPILHEIAVSFDGVADAVVAKMDATANDFPTDIFDVKGFPTLYFSSSSGKILKYGGHRSKEGIIDFVKKNKDTVVKPKPVKDEL